METTQGDKNTARRTEVSASTDRMNKSKPRVRNGWCLPRRTNFEAESVAASFGEEMPAWKAGTLPLS